MTFVLLGCYAVREGLLWAASPLKVGTIVCPETTLDNYQHKLRNIPEVRRPQILCNGTLKYRLMQTSQSPLLCTVSYNTKSCLIVTANSGYFPTTLTDSYWHGYEMCSLSARKLLFIKLANFSLNSLNRFLLMVDTVSLFVVHSSFFTGSRLAHVPFHTEKESCWLPCHACSSPCTFCAFWPIFTERCMHSMPLKSAWVQYFLASSNQKSSSMEVSRGYFTGKTLEQLI